MKKNTAKKVKESLQPQRGSIIAVKKGSALSESMAVIVSNEVQNEVSDYLLAVPLERRVSRLKAPFAVDLGRSDGLRELHCARCDWLSRIERKHVSEIIKAKLSEKALEEIEQAMVVALDLRR